MIEGTAIQVLRGKRPVFEAAALRLSPGQCVAVVGPNGAGKSTLLQLLAGALPAHRGEVRVHGMRPEHWSSRERAARLAYLTQEEQASPFSVREVLAMGLYALPRPTRTSSPLGPAQRTIRMQDMLERMELSALADRPLDRLSGGQQRRVHLARVLLQAEAFAAFHLDHAQPSEPAIKPWILLDEPTDALDPRHALLVVEHLRRQAKVGHGVLAVLHDLNLAAAMADRVLLVHDGKLLADGSPQAVLQPDVLEDAYGCAFHRSVLRGADGRMRPMLLPHFNTFTPPVPPAPKPQASLPCGALAV